MKALIRAALNPSEHAWFKLRPWQRHSLVLAVSGATYFAIGLSYILSQVSPSRKDGLWVLLSLAPMTFWGSIWIFVGALVVVSSRWPPASKTWGYAALSGLSSGWAAAYAVGFVFGGPHATFSSVLVWGLVAFLWWSIAGLVNPDDMVSLLQEDEKRRDGGEWIG